MKTPKISPSALRFPARRGVTASALIAAAMLFPCLPEADAATSYWNGLGTDNNWSTDGNWTAGAPGSTDPTNINGDAVYFQEDAGPTVTLNGTRSIQRLWFQTANVGSYTINATPGSSLVFNNGVGIQLVGTAPSGITIAVNAPILIGSNITITNARSSGDSVLHIGGDISARATGAYTISLGTASGTNTSTGNNIISGIISDGVSGATVAVSAATYGSSTWTISGENTFTGNFTWTQSGNLNVNKNSALGRGELDIRSGGTIDNTSGESVLLQNSKIILNNNLTFRGSGNLDFGNAEFNFGTLGTATYRRFTINGGNLTIGGKITDGVVMTGDGAGSPINRIYVEGNGTGILTLSGANEHTGGISLYNGGGLNINHANALGAGTLLITAGTGARIDNTSGAAITIATNNAQNWQGDFTFIGTNDLNLGTGDVFINAPGRTVAVLNRTLTVGGVINAGVNSWNKAGAGTLALDGNNTYYGKTSVNAGTLLVNGVHADDTQTTSADRGYGDVAQGHYQIANGATLGGEGRIAGWVNRLNSNVILVENGGSIAPGNAGIGTFTLDGAKVNRTPNNVTVLRMSSGATFEFELAGNLSDQIHFWNYVSGDFILNGNEINLTLSGALADGEYTATLFQFFSDGGSTLVTSGTLGNLIDGLAIGSLDPRIVGTPELFYNLAGNSIELKYTIQTTVIPEPTTWSLLGGGLVLAGLLRRRRKADGNPAAGA